MRNIALLIAALAVSFPLAAQAKFKPFHRLSPEPGITLTLPDGWMACDPASNKALGNAARIVAIEQVCASLQKTAKHAISEEMEAFGHYDMHMLMESDPASHLMLLTLHTDAFVIPDDYFSNASPAMLAQTGAVICDTTGPVPLQDCSFTSGQIDGRPAFIGTASGPPEGGRRTTAKLYVFAGGNGTDELVFVSDRALTPKAQAEMEAIVRSVKVDPPVVSPVVPVPIAPIPGVTLSVPKGWAACDAATNAMLGGVSAPDLLKKAICDEQEEPNSVRVFNPHPPYFETFAVSMVEPTGDFEAVAQNILAADKIAEDKDDDCRKLISPFQVRGYKRLSCEAGLGELGGLPARVVTYSVEGVPASAKLTARLATRISYVPVKGKIWIVVLIASSILEPRINATQEAIASSIAFP